MANNYQHGRGRPNNFFRQKQYQQQRITNNLQQRRFYQSRFQPVASLAGCLKKPKIVVESSLFVNDPLIMSSQPMIDYHPVMLYEGCVSSQSIGTFDIGSCVAVAGLCEKYNKCFVVQFDSACISTCWRTLGSLFYGLYHNVPDNNKEKIVLTGNPVRQDLIAIDGKRAEGIAYFKLDPNKKTILILGGSLGARRVNQLIEKELEFFASQKVQLLWQCGKLYFEEYQKYNSENVQVMAFIERMDLVYAAADIVISRAGASSVSELCIVGKPVIFIPSPNVAEDHQTKNAKSVADKNGAILIRESELDTTFESTFSDLISNESKQDELSQNIKNLALPNATKAIVEEILKLIK